MLFFKHVTEYLIKCYKIVNKMLKKIFCYKNWLHVRSNSCIPWEKINMRKYYKNMYYMHTEWKLNIKQFLYFTG